MRPRSEHTKIKQHGPLWSTQSTPKCPQHDTKRVPPWDTCTHAMCRTPHTSSTLTFKGSTCTHNMACPRVQHACTTWHIQGFSSMFNVHNMAHSRVQFNVQCAQHGTFKGSTCVHNMVHLRVQHAHATWHVWGFNAHITQHVQDFVHIVNSVCLLWETVFIAWHCSLSPKTMGLHMYP